MRRWIVVGSCLAAACTGTLGSRTTGSGTGSGDRGDDPPIGDVGDAGGPSWMPPADGGGAPPAIDAGPALPPPRTLSGIYGTVTYDHRAISTSGLAAAVPEPAPGVTVELLAAGGTVAGTTITDAEGIFEHALVPGVTQVRIRAQLNGPEGQLSVADHAGAAYAWTHPVVAETDNAVHLREADDAGAMAILLTMHRGMLFADAALGVTAAPRTTVHWERGRNTPGGTSYLEGGYEGDPVTAVWILGTPDDTDEYDVPVLLHELGHVMQQTHGWTHVVDGEAHAGNATDPRNAWSEGGATFFGALVLDSNIYIDSHDSGATAGWSDLNDPDTSQRCSASGGITQTISEDLISAIGWKIYRESSDAATQRAHAFAVLRDWIGGTRDRGASGEDLVDYLDGYLCMHGMTSAETVRRFLVEERGFPYDFRGSCKPWRERREVSVEEICAGGPQDVACSWSLGPDGVGPLGPRVTLERDATGRRLHVVSL